MPRRRKKTDKRETKKFRDERLKTARKVCGCFCDWSLLSSMAKKKETNIKIKQISELQKKTRNKDLVEFFLPEIAESRHTVETSEDKYMQSYCVEESKCPRIPEN